MKTILLALFLTGSLAQAAVTPIFSGDGTTASFLLGGMPGDPDANGLWHALKIPAESFQGKLAKHLSLVGPGGGKLFNLACAFSPTIQNTGSCTVSLRDTPGLVEVHPRRSARLWLRGDAAVQFAQAFVVREDATVLFRSRDGRLNISVARDGGAITDFVVDWR